MSEVIWNVQATVEPSGLALPNNHVFGGTPAVGWWVGRQLDGALCRKETERYRESIERCEEAGRDVWIFDDQEAVSVFA
jgi:hypothetical protein